MPEETTSKPTKVLWIDPPEGWKHGFPREVPKGIEADAINEWMIKVGYPRAKMEAYGEHFYCGMWYEEKDEA